MPHDTPFDADSAPPGRPTRALPRTVERLRVLQARAARGEALAHPRDADCIRDDSKALAPRRQAGRHLPPAAVRIQGQAAREEPEEEED